MTTKSGVQLSNKAYRGGLQGIIVSGRVRARTPCLGVSPTLSDCAVRRAGCALGVGCVRARAARAHRQLAPLGGQMRSSSLPTPFRPILEQPIARLIVAPRCEPVRCRLVAWLQRGQNRRLSTPVSFAWPGGCTRLNRRVHTKLYVKMKAPKVLDHALMRVVAPPRCASAPFAQIGLRAASAPSPCFAPALWR